MVRRADSRMPVWKVKQKIPGCRMACGIRLREIGGNASLENVERQQGTRHPGWPQGSVSTVNKAVWWQESDLLEWTALDQLGQERSGSTADDTAIPTKPYCRDSLFRIDVEFYADAVSAQSIDVFVGDLRRWQSAIIARMAKMLENGCTIRWHHRGLSLLGGLPPLTQR